MGLWALGHLLREVPVTKHVKHQTLIRKRLAPFAFLLIRNELGLSGMHKPRLLRHAGCVMRKRFEQFDLLRAHRVGVNYVVGCERVTRERGDGKEGVGLSGLSE